MAGILDLPVSITCKLPVECLENGISSSQKRPVIFITGFREKNTETFAVPIQLAHIKGFDVRARNMPDHETREKLLNANVDLWAEELLDYLVRLSEYLGSRLDIGGFSFGGALVAYCVHKRPDIFNHVFYANPATELQWYIRLGSELYKVLYWLLPSIVLLLSLLSVAWLQSLSFSLLGIALAFLTFIFMDRFEFSLGPDYVHTDDEGNETFYSGIPVKTGSKMPALTDQIWKVIQENPIDSSHDISFTFVRGAKDWGVSHDRMDRLAEDLGDLMHVHNVPNGKHNVLLGMPDLEIEEALEHFFA